MSVLTKSIIQKKLGLAWGTNAGVVITLTNALGDAEATEYYLRGAFIISEKEMAYTLIMDK